MTKTNYREEKLHRGNTFKCMVSLLLVASLEVSSAQPRAQDQWWFEIEAIVFERAISPSAIEEHFPLEATYIASDDLPDFITATLLPDFDFLRQGGKTCLAPEIDIAFPRQTAKPKRFLDVSSQNLLNEVVANHHQGPSETLLEASLLSLPEWVVENKPSEDWELRLLNFLSDVSTEFSNWKATNKTADYPFSETAGDKQKIELTRLPKTLYCQWPSEQAYFPNPEINKLRNYAFLPQIPSIIDGIEKPYSDIAYALPSNQLKLTKLRRDINRTRGLTVLLHTAWRQNVIVGRDNAPWYRLVAGTNYSKEFSYAGLPLEASERTDKTETKTLFEQISAILSEDPSEQAPKTAIPEQLLALQTSSLNTLEDEVWALDGRIKIFIEYLGRTPYLHLDSDLNYRKPIYIDWQGLEGDENALSDADKAESNNAIAPASNFLKSFHFDQLRRMISTELHYFDHPLFGMVVQIRRYQRPEPPETN